MIISFLSCFDEKVGPKVFLKVPEVEDYFNLNHISLLLDFYDEGFFIHSFGEINTVNLIFKLASPVSRGREKILMISLAIVNEEYDLNSFEEVLIIFVEGLKKINESYVAFQKDAANSRKINEKYQEIKSYLELFYNSLPKEKAMFKLRVTKILFFGLPQSGITTIINSLHNTFFNNAIMKGEVSIIKDLLGNLSIITYDLTDKNYIRKIPSIYLKNVDGIVFVLDASNITHIQEACKLLHQLNDFPDTFNLPLLILLNKSDLGIPNVGQLLKDLKIETLKNTLISSYIISALKNDGIIDAFSWLTSQIANNILRNPKVALL